MTNWKWQVIIVVPLAAKAAADAMAAQVTAEHQDNTFAVMLAPSSNGQATYCACAAMATDEWLAAMQGLLPSVPGLSFWRIDRDGNLAATNSNAEIGSPFGWWDCLESVGLHVVSEPAE
jgi:hypothetical protein